MKTIITSLLLLFCFNVSAQWKPSVSSDYDKWKEDQSKNYSNVKQPTSFKDIPQSEINLGLHKFKEQHRTGTNLIIGGLIVGTLGNIALYNNYKNNYSESQKNPKSPIYKSNKNLSYTIIGLGSILTTAGFIVNIDSFRHIK